MGAHLAGGCHSALSRAPRALWATPLQPISHRQGIMCAHARQCWRTYAQAAAAAAAAGAPPLAPRPASSKSSRHRTAPPQRFEPAARRPRHFDEKAVSQHAVFPVPHHSLYGRLLAKEEKDTLLVYKANDGPGPFLSALTGGLICGFSAHEVIDIVLLHHGDFHASMAWMTSASNAVRFGFGAFLALRNPRPVGTIRAHGLGDGLKLTVSSVGAPRIPGTDIYLWKPQRVECALADVKVQHSVFSDLPISIPKRIRIQEQELEALDAEDAVKKNRVLRIFFPFKRLYRWLVRTTQNGLLGRGNVTLDIQPISGRKQRWQLDVNRSFMLDKGGALEALLKDK